MMYFLLMHLQINLSTQKLQTLQVHRSHDVDGTGECSCYIGPKVKHHNLMMYFLVNASLPKELDIEISNFAGALIT